MHLHTSYNRIIFVLPGPAEMNRCCQSPSSESGSTFSSLYKMGYENFRKMSRGVSEFSDLRPEDLLVANAQVRDGTVVAD